MDSESMASGCAAPSRVIHCIVYCLGILFCTGLHADATGEGMIQGNGCMQDIAGFALNCTANDVRVSGVADVTADGVIDESDITFKPICDATASNAGTDCSADASICRDADGKPEPELCGDRCAFPGDTTTFSATFVFELSAQERYDVGAYFETGLDANHDGALTGSCAIITLPETGSFTRPDGSSGEYVDLDTACKGGSCPQPADLCGDINNSNNPIYYDMKGPKAVADTITAKCVDTDGDGKLNLPNCTSWRQSGANGLCGSPSDAYPGAPSKCNCDPAFQVPIEVPAARLKVVKTPTPTQLDEPGGVVKFSVDVTNESPFAAVEITELSDDVYGSITSVHGSITSTNCSVPQTGLLAGTTYSCDFMAQVSGGGGTVHEDTVTARGIDENDNLLEGFDDATVDILDVMPGIRVAKTASPTDILEPGANVTFSIEVFNTSASSGDELTLTGLTDSIYGNLAGMGTCTLPQSIAWGASYSCSFTVPVSGGAGDSETDKVTATAQDEEGNVVYDNDTATVVIHDVPSSIEITKTASPSEVKEPGGDVIFSFSVKNTSAVDSVTIDSLTDSIYGDLDQRGTCSVPQVIPAGGSYSCSFTVFVAGPGDTSETDIATVSGKDDDGNTVLDMDDATVDIIDVAPAATLTKTAVSAVVTYAVKVQNDSTAESLDLATLEDDKFGDITTVHDAVQSTTCSLPRTIEVGGYYSCSFAATVGSSPHTNTVSGMVWDDENNSVNPPPSDSATVTLQ